MATNDKRKQSLYFPQEMLVEMEAEAMRQDRSLSWIVQQAWRVARAKITHMPGSGQLPPAPPTPEEGAA